MESQANGLGISGILLNLLTGQTVKVYATTDSPDSSYGLPCWVDDEGQSYGQVQFRAPFGFQLLGITQNQQENICEICGKKCVAGAEMLVSVKVAGVDMLLCSECVVENRRFSATAGE